MANKTTQYKDLNFFFDAHPSTLDVTKKTEQAAISQSLKNLILTKNYERPFHPEIGCQLHSLLFELNWDPINEFIFKQTIIDVINKFEPRIVIIDINVTSDVDNSQVIVDIYYRLANSDLTLTFSTLINRVR